MFKSGLVSWSSDEDCDDHGRQFWERSWTLPPEERIDLITGLDAMGKDEMGVHQFHQ